MSLTKDLYSRAGQICSIEESLAENQKQQRAPKSVCGVKYSSINNAGFTWKDQQQIACSPWQLTVALRIRVNTLINETNIKYEATTRYQFEMLLFSWKSHTKYVGEPQFAHHCSIAGVGN